MWSYAAQNQPDGDFSSYLPSELALLIGWQADAQALLEALQKAGFLDEMKIHGWEERNSYHTVFADRAKKAAAARWEKEGDKKRKREKRREEASNASSMDGFEDFWTAYPRKTGKGKAEEAWKKHEAHKITLKILTTIRKLKISHAWTKDGGQFIPHPTSWLNSKGWEDEVFELSLNGVDSQPAAYRVPMNAPPEPPPHIRALQQ